MALQAILFDVDGTLAETERDGHRVAFNQAFEKNGLDWFWDEALYAELLAVGGGYERLAAWVNDYLPKYPKLQRPMDEQSILRKVYADKTKSYTALVAAGKLPLRPGVKRLMAEVKAAGLKLAVVTNSALPSVTALTQRYWQVNPDELFDVCATGNRLSKKKPNPEAYELALSDLGLSAGECVAIEDSAVGLQAARACKIATVVTCSFYTEHEDFSGASWVLSDLGEPDAACQIFAGASKDLDCVTPKALMSLCETTS